MVATRLRRQPSLHVRLERGELAMSVAGNNGRKSLAHLEHARLTTLLKSRIRAL